MHAAHAISYLPGMTDATLNRNLPRRVQKILIILPGSWLVEKNGDRGLEAVLLARKHLTIGNPQYYISSGRSASLRQNWGSVTVEHTYDACPKYSELGSFRIIAYLYVSDGSRRWQCQYSKKKVKRFYI